MFAPLYRRNEPPTNTFSSIAKPINAGLALLTNVALQARFIELGEFWLLALKNACPPEMVAPENTALLWKMHQYAPELLKN